MKPKAIIFDFDGTLFDTSRDIADAVNYARRYFNLPELSLEFVKSKVGDGITILAERIFSGTSIDPIRAKDKIMEYYTNYPGENARPYPGVIRTLDKLPMLKLIVSNKQKGLIDKILSINHMQKYFDLVVGGDTFENIKPHPEAVDYILKKYLLSPEDLLIVGDHSPDIEMAKSRGIKSVYCNYGFFGKDTIGADYAIDTFEELLRLF